MKATRYQGLSLLAGALALGVACAPNVRQSPADARPTPTQAQPRQLSQDSLARLEALYQARLDSARMRFTDADVRFITGMIAHHAQAITMARWIPDRTTTQAMHILGGRIINAQQDEIVAMQRWLRDRRQPVPEVHDMGGQMMVHGGGDHSLHAPGMLTPEQMQQLERARGEEFDRLFLTFMIQHHEGATAMVRELFATDGAAQDEEVFKLAADIEADQTSEITRMKTMLEAMAGTDRQR